MQWTAGSYFDVPIIGAAVGGMFGGFSFVFISYKIAGKTI